MDPDQNGQNPQTPSDAPLGGGVPTPPATEPTSEPNPTPATPPAGETGEVPPPPPAMDEQPAAGSEIPSGDSNPAA